MAVAKESDNTTTLFFELGKDLISRRPTKTTAKNVDSMTVVRSLGAQTFVELKYSIDKVKVRGEEYIP